MIWILAVHIGLVGLVAMFLGGWMILDSIESRHWDLVPLGLMVLILGSMLSSIGAVMVGAALQM